MVVICEHQLCGYMLVEEGKQVKRLDEGDVIIIRKYGKWKCVQWAVLDNGIPYLKSLEDDEKDEYEFDGCEAQFISQKPTSETELIVVKNRAFLRGEHSIIRN